MAFVSDQFDEFIFFVGFATTPAGISIPRKVVDIRGT